MSTLPLRPRCAPALCAGPPDGWRRRAKWRQRLRRQVGTVLGPDPQATAEAWGQVNAHRLRYGTPAVPFAEFVRAIEASPVDPEKQRQRQRQRDRTRRPRVRVRKRVRGEAQRRAEAAYRQKRWQQRLERRLEKLPPDQRPTEQRRREQRRAEKLRAAKGRAAEREQLARHIRYVLDEDTRDTVAAWHRLNQLRRTWWRCPVITLPEFTAALARLRRRGLAESRELPGVGTFWTPIHPENETTPAERARVEEAKRQLRAERQLRLAAGN